MSLNMKINHLHESITYSTTEQVINNTEQKF